MGYMKPVTPILYTISPQKPQRPIMAPEVMVEAVSANANWKTQKDSSGIPVDKYVAGRPCRKKPCVPIHGLPGSNIKAKPQAQNKTPQMQVSAIPSTRIFTDSRERAKPASSITKPTCIPKTRNAATNTQTVLIALISGVGAATPVAALATIGRNVHIATSTSAKPTSFPPI